MSCRTTIESGILMVGLLGIPLGQSNGKPGPEPKFTGLARDDETRLDQPRAVVAAAAKRDGAGVLARKKSDLQVLQELIDDRVFKKAHTYELQCLGVALGDVLSSELPLRWIMVTDEYGTVPTLRFKKTTIQINALTMIAKRIERNQPVDLSALLRMTRDQITQAEQNLR